MEMLYYCDPRKNKECSKKQCFMNDGPCTCTRNIKYAKLPITTTKMVFDAEVLEEDERR